MKKGRSVTIVVVTPFATTEEARVIEKVTKTKIFIEGLDIPFDRITGKKIETFNGSSVYIKELKK